MSLGPLMIDLAGTTVTPEERELLRHPLVGGVILFTRNYEDPAQLTELVSAIHAARAPPLIVGVDQEGGRVQRFRQGFSLLPPARRIGHEFDLDARAGLALARALGWLMAAELRAHGVDISFAPCVDLDHGVSEVIGDRAFHASPEAVGQLAVAWMHGMRDAGMGAVAKHFPGHGAVVADSHLTLPVDRRPLADLAGELAPYRRLIANGLPALMGAHVLFPAVDPAPAGLSRSVTIARASSSCSTPSVPSHSRPRACASCACTGGRPPTGGHSRRAMSGAGRASSWRGPRAHRPSRSIPGATREQLVRTGLASRRRELARGHRDLRCQYARLAGALRQCRLLRDVRLSGHGARRHQPAHSPGHRSRSGSARAAARGAGEMRAGARAGAQLPSRRLALLERDGAQRDSHEIGLTLFDIDDLGAYNDKFDRSAGDACIRRVARVVGAAYRRRGDLVGRWEGGTFCVLTQGEAADKATQYAQVVSQRVRDLLMHHPTAGAGRYVTLSAGIASLVPPRSLPLDGLLKACRAALKRAKKNGKDAIVTAGAGDFH